MPYTDPIRSKYANKWFSATFAPNQDVFSYIMSKKNIDLLSKSNGVSIVYTHFGYFFKDNELDKRFVKSINYLSSKKNGVFRPVSQTLNDIANERKSMGLNPYPKINSIQKFKFELLHLITRIYYRKFLKIDDYSFKNLKKEMFLKN